jgi:post-segregation antitoxin (ccd killing protein)
MLHPSLANWRLFTTGWIALSTTSWYLDIMIPKREDVMARKNMTLRLPVEQADELEAVARAEGISVSDAVREAIAEHIERKRKDKAFRERLRTVMERDREILERLAR